MNKRKRRTSGGRERGGITALPFLLPAIAGFTVFYLAPMVISVFISMTDWNGLDRLLAPRRN